MIDKKRYISPLQFDIIHRTIQREETLGNSPEYCVLKACHAVGIRPPNPFEPIELVVVNGAQWIDKEISDEWQFGLGNPI